MIKPEGTTVQPLTRELAERFSSMKKWSGERELKTKRLNMLIARINDGLFHSPNWSTAYAKFDQSTYRMNGQHSSTALVRCEKFPVGLQAVIQRFTVDTKEDLALLFDQFDNQQSSRRMSDIINAHASIDDDLSCYPKRLLNACLAGIVYTKGISGRSDNSERAQLMYAYKPFILFSSQFSGKDIFLKQPVMSAMLRTYETHSKASEVFWRLVDTETHQCSNNPTRYLARFLGRETHLWDTRAIMVKCLHAWNAYWRNTTTVLAYFKSAPIPEIICPPIPDYSETE